MPAAKIAGTTTLTVDGMGRISPDTVRVGNITIRFAYQSGYMLAICGAKPTTVVQFLPPFGSVRQRADTSSSWNQFGSYPDSNLVTVDTIAAIAGENGSMDPLSGIRAPGFALFSAGTRNTCSGAEYFMASRWNRVVFLRYGSGVDYRAKLSFQVIRDTSYAPTMMLQYSELRSIVLHYVVNRASSDLSGAPVSLRVPRPTRVSTGLKAGDITELYNPLGVKVREPKRFQAVVPLRH